MERNREARRVSMAATGNGFSRRRHRAGSFRDSPEEEIPVEFPETARLRDRGRTTTKKDRDRLYSRSKRRRGERVILMQGNLDDDDGGGEDDDDTSDESINDDEEYNGGGGGGPPSSLLPPALINHHNGLIGHHLHHQRKSFPPPVTSWKATDEMIGVSVPRKARSASTKRSSGGGVFASGEQIHRKIPTSPATANPASPSPPKQKQFPAKSPVTAQEEIEIEIAEVLYGMMRQPSKQESTGNDSGEISNHNVSAIAPKRKRPRLVKYEEENIEEEEELKPSLDLSSTAVEQPEKKEKEEKQSPEMEQIDINLMTQPQTRSSPARDNDIECVTTEAKPRVTIMESETKPLLEIKEDEVRNCELIKLDLEISDADIANKHHVQKQKLEQQLSGSEKAAQANPLPLQMSVPGWTGGIPTMGYLGPTQGVMPIDASSLPSTTMQQPPHLLFNQPRPKRCATHCYIARNIHYHQQFTKMNPFWPAAAAVSTPLYGSKACNLSLMPSAELQGSVLSRGTNSVPDKSSQSTPNSSDPAQRKQILLHQTLPPGAGNTILHGPTFIFPLGQQPHAAAAIAAASIRPPNTGNTAGATAASASMNGSASANPVGATTMTYSYPNMPNNETQYLAILQNNGYPFPVPAHAGAPPAYRGVSGQPIPFFNGSFYSSQMVHTPHLPPQQQSGQGQQSHAPSNLNTNVSTGSSAAQKHLQSQQRRPPVNSQGFPTQKVQSQPSRQQPRENTTQLSETARANSPSTADSRGSRSNVAYGQNFAIPMQPTNMGMIGSATSSSGVVSSSNNHGEKKPEQQGSKAGTEAMHSQPYAIFHGVNMPPSIAQNHAIFHGVPDTSRQGYHQMMAAAVASQAAKQKMNYNSQEDGKSGFVAAANATEERKTTGANGKTTTTGAFSSKQDSADVSASAVTGGNIIDSSARLLNLGSVQPWSSSSAPTSHQQQHMQRNQPQQQYNNYLQMQQQYAVAAARGKGPVTSNGSVLPDHNTATVPNACSGFPQNLVQSGGGSSPVQSPQWKNNSPRANTMAQAQSPSMLSPSASSFLKNVQQKQQGRPPQQAQISFAATSKTLPPPNSPMQHGPSGANRSPSPSTSSVSKSAGGSPRTTPSPTTANKAGHGQASSSTLSSSQASKNSQSASFAGGRNNGQSVIGNPHVTTTTSNPTSKSQQQQAQLFFSNPYMQPQHHQQQQMTISPGSGYYIQRHQQQQQAGSSAAALSVTPSSCTTTVSDPAKAINMKGGGNNNNLQHTQTTAGKTPQQQLVPPGFPYVHAGQVKPGDQKQQAAGE